VRSTSTPAQPRLDRAGDDLSGHPRAPEGPLYRGVTLEDLDDPGPFGAAGAGRVLHHVDPLGPALDKLVGPRWAGDPGPRAAPEPCATVPAPARCREPEC